MKITSSKLNHDPQSFEHVLQDFLDIKAQMGQKNAGPIKKLLSYEHLQAFDISALEGFSVDRQLILFRSDGPKSFRQLIFLNPVSGVIQAHPLF